MNRVGLLRTASKLGRCTARTVGFRGSVEGAAFDGALERNADVGAPNALEVTGGPKEDPVGCD